MPFKSALLVLSCLCLSLVAKADLYADFHSEGMPQKIGEKSVAINYLNRFLSQDLESSEGLGLVRWDTPLNEWVFFNNTKRFEYKSGYQPSQVYLFEKKVSRWSGKKKYVRVSPKSLTVNDPRVSTPRYSNGVSVLNHLKKYTKNFGCISKLTIAGHGWPSHNRWGEGNALKTDGSLESGIHLFSAKDDPRYLAPQGAYLTSNEAGYDSRSLESLVDNGEVKFCEGEQGIPLCLIQIHSCNISVKFAKTFAKVSGCQTVLPVGRAAPDPDFATANGSGDIHWISSDYVRDGSNARSGFVRATPINGEVVLENLGGKYTSF